MLHIQKIEEQEKFAKELANVFNNGYKKQVSRTLKKSDPKSLSGFFCDIDDRLNTIIEQKNYNSSFRSSYELINNSIGDLFHPETMVKILSHEEKSKTYLEKIVIKLTDKINLFYKFYNIKLVNYSNNLNYLKNTNLDFSIFLSKFLPDFLLNMHFCIDKI